MVVPFKWSDSLTERRTSTQPFQGAWSKDATDMHETQTCRGKDPSSSAIGRATISSTACKICGETSFSRVEGSATGSRPLTKCIIRGRHPIVISWITLVKVLVKAAASQRLSQRPSNVCRVPTAVGMECWFQSGGGVNVADDQFLDQRTPSSHSKESSYFSRNGALTLRTNEVVGGVQRIQEIIEYMRMRSSSRARDLKDLKSTEKKKGCPALLQGLPRSSILCNLHCDRTS